MELISSKHVDGLLHVHMQLASSKCRTLMASKAISKHENTARGRARTRPDHVMVIYVYTYTYTCGHANFSIESHKLHTKLPS
jgi:hypothetical protein